MGIRRPTARRLSAPSILTTLIAVLGTAGALVPGFATSAGTAPGNGEQIFDAPGCGPPEYDGPGSASRRLLPPRNCARPKAVIVLHTTRSAQVWRVSWDGSRSFDPIGGRLVKYEWSTGHGPPLGGPIVSMTYTRPGLYKIVLYLTDDSGTIGTGSYTVRLR